MFALPIPSLFALQPALSVAHAASVSFECTPDAPEVRAAGDIVGTAPLRIDCTVLPPAVGSYSEASWTFGDGTVVYGDTASFEYTEPGQYNVSVRLEDFDPQDGTALEQTVDPELMRYGFITVCDSPNPAFTYINKGGLDFQLVNQSTVEVDCLDTLVWEVFRGEPDGEPEWVFDTWEPRFQLPESGRWTLRLTMSGIGGTSVAELELRARYKLTDDLKNAPHEYGCAVFPGIPGWLLAGAGLGLSIARRRRR